MAPLNREARLTKAKPPQGGGRLLHQRQAIDRDRHLRDRVAVRLVTKLHDAFKKAIEDPEVIKVLDRFGMAANYRNSADYKLAVKEQIKLERAPLGRIGLLKK